MFMVNIPKVLIIMESSRIAGQSTIAGIAHYAQLHGPWIFLTEPPFYIRSRRKENLLRWIQVTKPQGIILRDSDLVPGLEKLGIPIVVSQVLRDVQSNYPLVAANDKAIGELAASYFLGRGYRNFAYCGFKDMPWSKARGNSFQDAIKKTSHTAYNLESRYSNRRIVWGAENPAMLKWIISLPKPAAIMTCNDDVGRQVLDACRTAQIQVPEKVAVLGVDNESTACNLSYPSLSSIALNFEKAGYLAAELLAELMSNKKISHQKIVIEPVRVITRQSTESTAIEDPDVAAALHYLRQNAMRPLQIQDVADVVCLSRRTLYDKFLKSLGNSVHKEIRSARIEAISKMLLETNMPISKIAISLGFSSDKHISRYFSKETGLSLRTYRTKYQAKQADS